MGLNIKNPETHRLAEELAKRTGESMTAAVTTAVRERLDRVRREQGDNLADRLLAIGKDCAKRLRAPFRSAAHDDLFYDDRGLPGLTKSGRYLLSRSSSAFASSTGDVRFVAPGWCSDGFRKRLDNLGKLASFCGITAVDCSIAFLPLDLAAQ